MRRIAPAVCIAAALACAAGFAPAGAQMAMQADVPQSATRGRCAAPDLGELSRNPTASELRCAYHGHGPGRFGLSVYMEVPVYQPATPFPGTHVVGVPGMPRPMPGESFEEWEWRVLRTEYGPGARQVHRALELLDPFFATRILEFEALLREAGVRFHRRETWRSPDRQAFLFQQGRSRPGPLVTATLTSLHSRVNGRGTPAGIAADYNVPRAQMQRFHEIAWAVGLESYGPESNDPGHVYLPGSHGLSERELAMLRLLPRVPTVTLSTGRPTDQVVTRADRSELRRAAEEFVMWPFIPHPAVRLAGQSGPTSIVQAIIPPPAPSPEPQPQRGKRARRR